MCDDQDINMVCDYSYRYVDERNLVEHFQWVAYSQGMPLVYKQDFINLCIFISRDTNLHPYGFWDRNKCVWFYHQVMGTQMMWWSDVLSNEV